jgi:hypothetical protein
MKHLVRLLAQIVVIVGALAAAHSLYLGYVLARPSLIFDALGSVVTYQRLMAGDYNFTQLFALHNEHRIPVGNILSLVDAACFDFTNRFLLFVIYATLALIALIVALLTVRTRFALNVAAAFLVALGLAWAIVQYENLGWGFEVHFPLVHLLALLCFICVVKSLRSPALGAEAGWMLLALVFDALSLLTLTSGLITGIVATLVLPLVLRRFSFAFLGFLVAHIAMITLYLHGEIALRPPGGDTTAWDVVRFFLRSLGTLGRDAFDAPFEDGPFIVGVVLLVAALGIGLSMLWKAQIEKRSAPPASAVLLTLVSFIVLEVAIITIGRIHADPDQAIVSRYATHSIILAMAILALYWRTFSGFRAVTVGAAGVFIALSNMPYSVARWRYFIADQDRAVFAIVNGVFLANDAILPPDISGREAFIKNGYEYLRSVDKGPFAKSSHTYRPPAILYDPITELPKCRADVQLSKHAGYIKISGWLVAPSLSKAPIWIMAYSNGGKLVGYARPTSQRPDIRTFVGSRTDDMFGFELFLPQDNIGDGIRLISTFAPRESAAACSSVVIQ